MAKTKLKNILSVGLRTFTIISAALFTCQFGMFTGTALAQSGMGSAPSCVSTQTTEANSELYKIQAEIDQYIFKDHEKEIEEKGFKIIYTAITDTNVEIGITPMNDDNASYLYQIFGNTTIKVVAAKELSTSREVPPDAVAVDYGLESQTAAVTSAGSGLDSQTTTATATCNGSDSQIVTTTAADNGPDSQIAEATVAGTSGADSESIKRDIAVKENAAGNNGEVQIQIEAAKEDGLLFGKPETANVPTAAASDSKAAIKVTSTAADMAVKTVPAVGQHHLSAPVVILMIAGTAILAGCAIIILGRKKM